jgi:AcrR family transcriptional regulator
VADNEATNDVSPVTTQRRNSRRAPGEGRRLLLEAAKELFGESGYARTTTRMISERAGVAEALLFRNFGSKAALFTEVTLGPFRQFIDDWKSRHADDGLADSPEQLLSELVGAFYDLFRDNSRLMITYIATSVFDPDVVGLEKAPLFMETIDTLARWSKRDLIEAHAFGPVDILVANRAYVGMLLSMALFEDWLVTEVGRLPTRDEIVAELSSLILYGVNRPRQPNPDHTNSEGQRLPAVQTD